MLIFFFFFSSRRRHTRSLCDWSSDVCSSDPEELARRFGTRHGRDLQARANFHGSDLVEAESGPAKSRSSETTFDTDIADPAALEAVIKRLAAELCDDLRRKRARG